MTTHRESLRPRRFGFAMRTDVHQTRKLNAMYKITPKHDFLVGIDSDGCAFDTMELKHKECFIPNIINYYDLQAISKYAREAAEFVNLYSKSRGINRFPALVETLEWLQKRPEVARPRRHGRNPRVAESVDQRGDEAGQSGAGSQGGRDERSGPGSRTGMVAGRQRTIADMVRGVPPFPFVRECLRTTEGQGRHAGRSATPKEALQAEWEEHDD